MLQESRTPVGGKCAPVWADESKDITGDIDFAERSASTDGEWTLVSWGGPAFDINQHWWDRTTLFSDPVQREYAETLVPDDFVSASEDSLAQKANSDRLVLLARKYGARGNTLEEAARLEILDERVQQLIPSVTHVDIDRMEGIIARLEAIGEESDAVLRELGEAED